MVKKTRDTSRDYAELIPIPADIKKKYKHLNYDSCLHLRLYGEPYSDSRPRLNTNTMGVALINMNKMKKTFGEFYKRSELLQNLTIISPFHMSGKFFMNPTRKDLKEIKKNSKLNNLYKSGKIADLAIKDVDNMLKIHNDILFEPEFRITLEDAWNVGFIDSEKYISEEEYADIFVYYSSKPNSYYLWKIKQSHKYFRYLFSEKNMLVNKRTSKEQLAYIRKLTQSTLKEEKKEKEIKKILKRILATLEEYSADSIKAIADMQDYRYTKRDAQMKVMKYSVKGHRIGETIVDGIGVLLKNLETEELDGGIAEWRNLITLKQSEQ